MKDDSGDWLVCVIVCITLGGALLIATVICNRYEIQKLKQVIEKVNHETN